MKRNVIALFAGVFACALLFTGCGGSNTPTRVEDPVKYWKGESCPITGKKYADAPEDDAMAGNIPLQFEHDGMKYEAMVWDEKAIDTFEKNRDKYIPIITANSE